LISQISRELIDVIGQILPHPRYLRRLRLTTELPLNPDLTRDTSHLRSKPFELINHRIAMVLQLQKLALDISRNLLAQITVSDRRRHLGDVTHLPREISRHQVDVVSQLLPRPATLNRPRRRLTKLPLSPDLTRHTRNLRHEPVELINHRIDRVLELEHLTGQVRNI